jgi:hypothetical protein
VRYKKPVQSPVQAAQVRHNALSLLSNLFEIFDSALCSSLILTLPRSGRTFLPCRVAEAFTTVKYFEETHCLNLQARAPLPLLLLLWLLAVLAPLVCCPALGSLLISGVIEALHLLRYLLQ